MSCEFKRLEEYFALRIGRDGIVNTGGTLRISNRDRRESRMYTGLVFVIITILQRKE